MLGNLMPQGNLLAPASCSQIYEPCCYKRPAMKGQSFTDTRRPRVLVSMACESRSVDYLEKHRGPVSTPALMWGSRACLCTKSETNSHPYPCK
jgi:hypothetical protein